MWRWRARRVSVSAPTDDTTVDEVIASFDGVAPDYSDVLDSGPRVSAPGVQAPGPSADITEKRGSALALAWAAAALAPAAVVAVLTVGGSSQDSAWMAGELQVCQRDSRSIWCRGCHWQ